MLIDLKNKNIEELEDISKKIRNKILTTVSKKGGHLSSNIGAVELIVAMHHVFDVKKDPFIFDVSHQSYAHKLLTRPWEEFDTLRQFNGMSGFSKPNECEYDYFIAGHSSTSISLAVGAAKAIRLKKEDRLPVAFIGDGSMSAGIVYEALNELGDKKYPTIIILNDNEMSISKPIGAISNYLSQMMAGQIYQKFKSRVEKLLEYFPESAAYMAKRFEEGFKLITPGMLFEELGLEYIGPIDGHNLKNIIEAFKIAKGMKKPVIIHAQTLKGKGYEKAEGYYEHWHGVGPFDLSSGEAIKKTSLKSATDVFKDALLNLAKKYNNVVGVTAAMPSGTGLDALIKEFPERFWDVAIAEQHAVTSMAVMAKEGFKPYVVIYSTFLQRAFDQIIHDVCIMNLNVTFAIDRAGIVGEDGETHQGIFDISYLSLIPNMTLFAPRCNESLKLCLEYSYKHVGPCAFRYPRGNFGTCLKKFDTKTIVLGKGQILEEGDEIAFIGYGLGVKKAYEIKEILKNKINPTLVDLIFAKPLDDELLVHLAQNYKIWFIFSDSVKIGGIGEMLSLWLQENNFFDVKLETFEFNDHFIEHGEKKLVEESLLVDSLSISKKIQTLLGEKNISHS